MKDLDKFSSDLDAIQKRFQAQPGAVRLEETRRFFRLQFRGLPEECLADLAATLGARWEGGEAGALAWLRTVASLLLQDYDGSELSRDEWHDLKESLVLGSDEIDMDLLSYVMALVLDHGAL